MIGDSNDKNNFPRKLLLTNAWVSNIPEAFANGSLANTKLSKNQSSKIGQSGGFLGRFLGTLRKAGLSLMLNVLMPLAKSVLMPLGLTAAASATDAIIHKKMFGSDSATLIISIEEMNYIMKIVKSSEESGFLISAPSFN